MILQALDTITVKDSAARIPLHPGADGLEVSLGVKCANPILVSLCFPWKTSPGCSLPAPRAAPQQLRPAAAAAELSGSCRAERNDGEGSLHPRGP